MTPEQIKSRLEQVYSGGEVEVWDLTGTQDHYQVYVKSEKFNDLSRIQRQRHVMDLFAEELKSGEVHALTIRAESQT